MSYVPEFAPDARSQWLELAPELQEVVLDVIEYLLANPPLGPLTPRYHDAVHEDALGRHYIFVRVTFNRKTGKLGVGGVIHHLQPAMR